MKILQSGLTLSIGLLFLLIISSANAATFDFTLSDDGGFDISGFTFILDVESDFEIVSAQYSVPESGLWQHDLGPQGQLKDSKYKLEGSDWAPLMNMPPAPLLPGVIATFEYKGNIEGISTIQLSNALGEDLYAAGKIFILSEDSSGVILGTPIPSSMLLLGGGLLTIFGIRRRQ